MLAGDTSEISVTDTITLKQFIKEKAKGLEKAKELKCQAVGVSKSSPKGIKMGHERKKGQSSAIFSLLTSLTSLDMLQAHRV